MDLRTPDFRLDGRVAIVTGGGSGMGAASAAALAAYGAKVAVVDINAESARQVAEAIGASAYLCDVGDEQAVQATVEQIVAELGPVAILHNNAAVNMGYGAGDQRAHELATEVWRRNMAVNLDGTYFMTKYAIPSMLELGGGSIINTASLAGSHLGSNNTAYAATKGGVVAFTRALVISYAGTGIRANAISPGYVDTPMSQPVRSNPGDLERYIAGIPAGREGQPSDIGGLVVLLASDASAYINGAVIALDGGISLR